MRAVSARRGETRDGDGRKAGLLERRESERQSELRRLQPPLARGRSYSVLRGERADDGFVVSVCDRENSKAIEERTNEA